MLKVIFNICCLLYIFTSTNILLKESDKFIVRKVVVFCLGCYHKVSGKKEEQKDNILFRNTQWYSN